MTRNEVNAPDGVAIHYVHVVSLRPDGDTWKLLWSMETGNLARLLSRQ